VEDPLVAVKEEPEPVTLAFGVPEPHCAAAVERSANAVTKIDSLAIVTGGFIALEGGKSQLAIHRLAVWRSEFIAGE
jgi:hypothetical protein